MSTVKTGALFVTTALCESDDLFQKEVLVLALKSKSRIVREKPHEQEDNRDGGREGGAVRAREEQGVPRGQRSPLPPALAQLCDL